MNLLKLIHQLICRWKLLVSPVMKSQEEVCQFRQTFFGLTSKYKLELHDLLVTLSMNVEGGFSYESWYMMPVQLRTYYTDVIQKRTEDRTERLQSSMPKGIK